MRGLALMVLMLAAATGGCAAPRPVRELAAMTAPFVVATHGSLPGVERAYAAQTTRSSEELALYDVRRRIAERNATSIELLWSLRQTAPDKRSIGLVERIRRDDAQLRAPSPALVAPTLVRSRADASVGQISKVTELLKTVATSKGFDSQAAIAFGAATWKQLKKVDEDAAADAASTSGTAAK